MKKSRSRKTGRRGGSNLAGSPVPSGYLTSGVNLRTSLANFRQVGTAAAPFPMRWDTKLVYGVNVTLTTAGSVALGTYYRFRLNSLYDPDVTGTGHQPYQYDQLTAIYQNYIVKGCYVDLTFTDPTADGVWVGWSWHSSDSSNDDPSTLLLDAMLERPNFTCYPLNNTGAQSATVRQYFDMPTCFGQTRTEYFGDLTTHASAYNNNPSKGIHLDVFLCDPTANVGTRSVRISGRLVFDAQFYNYLAPAQS